jgi:endoglucanase
MVSHITTDGFLHFVPIGGWWAHVMLAQRVIIRTRKGDVPGFIGAKAPHLLTLEDRSKMVEINSMFIDIGAESKEEAYNSFGVNPGDPVVPDVCYKPMKNPELMMAKAWDNRVGCALYLELIDHFTKNKHPNTLIFAFTTQEEIGLRGAGTAAATVKPDACVVFDGCIANDYPNIKPGEPPVKLGCGPNLIIMDSSHIPNWRMRNFAFDIAKGEGIPLNPATLLGAGTDTGRILLYEQGIPSIALGVPRRYTHSHTSIIHHRDYSDALKLHEQLILRLDDSAVSGFKKFI